MHVLLDMLTNQYVALEKSNSQMTPIMYKKKKEKRKYWINEVLLYCTYTHYTR